VIISLHDLISLEDSLPILDYLIVLRLEYERVVGYYTLQFNRSAGLVLVCRILSHWLLQSVNSEFTIFNYPVNTEFTVCTKTECFLN